MFVRAAGHRPPQFYDIINMPIPSLSRKVTGLAALTALGLFVAAVLRRRFRLGGVLFYVAVALGERWRERREGKRIRALLATPPEASKDPEDPEDPEDSESSKGTEVVT